MSRIRDIHFEMLPERAFSPIGRHMTLEGKDSGSPPPPPNYAPIAAATDRAAKFGYRAAKEDLQFRRQVYKDSQPRQAKLYQLATQVAKQQMGIADANESRAAQQWQSYQDTYRPMELSTAADAYGAQHLGAEDQAQLAELVAGRGNMTEAQRMTALRGYSTKAEGLAADEAGQRAGAQVNAAQAQTVRGMARYGMNPARLAGNATQLSNQSALVRAGAQNQARDAARGQMMGLRTGVANFGRNMPNTAGQAFGLATQAGSSAVGNKNAGFMSGLPYAQFAAGGYGNQLGAAGLGMQGALGMGGVLNQGYGNQINAYNANQQAQGAGLAGIGQLAGQLGSAYLGYMGYAALAASDRAIKQDIVRMGTRPDGLGWYVYKFKPEYREQWGYGWQVGVMADEVEQLYPHAVAIHPDGYKLVDYGVIYG